MWNSPVLIRSAAGVRVSSRDYFNRTSRDDQDYKRGRGLRASYISPLTASVGPPHKIRL